jgi:transcriptional regulator with XRE-family HTH domain
MKAQDIINTVMETEKVTQKDLAAELGLTQQAVSKFKNGKGSLRVDTFVKILNKMGYTVVVRRTGIGKAVEWEVE